jgi:quinol monooxygenase YgiN
MMQIYIFVRFHAGEGNERAVEQALAQVVPPSREEAGCVGINAFRSTQDSRLFYVHSQWRDEAAFNLHATLAHTTKFVDAVTDLIDHPLEVTRTTVMGF